MEMRDHIQQLINKLIEGVDNEMLEMYDNGELEYWDGGNFDDTFQIGMSVGADEACLDIAKQLQDILNKF